MPFSDYFLKATDDRYRENRLNLNSSRSRFDRVSLKGAQGGHLSQRQKQRPYRYFASEIDIDTEFNLFRANRDIAFGAVKVCIVKI